MPPSPARPRHPPAPKTPPPRGYPSPITSPITPPNHPHGHHPTVLTPPHNPITTNPHPPPTLPARATHTSPAPIPDTALGQPVERINKLPPQVSQKIAANHRQRTGLRRLPQQVTDDVNGRLTRRRPRHRDGSPRSRTTTPSIEAAKPSNTPSIALRACSKAADRTAESPGFLNASIWLYATNVGRRLLIRGGNRVGQSIPQCRSSRSR